MILGRVSALAAVILFGSTATLFFYTALFVVQTENADSACESYPASVPGADSSDVRGVRFENSFLNLGGSCAYRMEDGSVVFTREPGWWFSGTIAGFVAVLAGLVVYLARRKGHQGWLFGLCALTAPPLGLLMVAVAPCKADGADAVF